MNLKRLGFFITILLLWSMLAARQGMDFQLYNLGAGNRDDFLSLSRQFSQAMSPLFLGEAETRGIRGFEVGVGYTMTTINSGADYWENGLNDEPTDYGTPPFYNGVDIHVRKGLSYGLKLYGNVRYFILTEMISSGVGVEYAVNEGMLKVPDISIGGGYNRLFSGGDMNMQMAEIRLKVSKTFVMAKEVKLTPLLAYTHLFVFSSSNRLGGYIDSFSGQNNAGYAADKAGDDFVFGQESFHIDRMVLGLHFSRGYFGMNLEAVLPFNALKSFSFTTGFSFKM